MKSSSQTKLLSLVLIFLSLISCKNTPTAPKNNLPNLITNPNFEQDGQPSLIGWIADTNLAKVVQDAPPGDGARSLQLSPGWLPQEGFAETYVSGQSGTGIFRLTLWIKSANGWKGTIKFGRWSHAGWSASKQAASDSTEWNQVTLTDTISVQATDTIAVHLSAGSVELAVARVFFADVTLQRIQ